MQDTNPSWATQLAEFDSTTDALFQPITPQQPKQPPFHLPRDYKEFEGRIEAQWLSHLRLQCQNEADVRAHRMQQAAGFLGIGRDEARLQELRNEVLPACAKLREYGYVRY